MAMIEPKSGKPIMQCDHLPPAEITGIIKMNSRQTCGVLAISFTEPLIPEVTKRMLGDDADTVDETHQYGLWQRQGYSRSERL